MQLKDSQTKINLMRAFAGESQARNRYIISASEAKKQHLHIIEAIFTFTADQEKEHAKIFYNHLKECADTNIHIDGGYPVDISTDIIHLLRNAHHNEYEEYSDAYPAFGQTAKEEGFTTIASSFFQIAEIEKTHGERFQKYADLLEQNKLFISNVEASFMCLNCGYIYKGTEAPPICPVCRHDQGFFLRLTCQD